MIALMDYGTSGTTWKYPKPTSTTTNICYGDVIYFHGDGQGGCSGCDDELMLAVKLEDKHPPFTPPPVPLCWVAEDETNDARPRVASQVESYRLARPPPASALFFVFTDTKGNHRR